MDELIIKVEGMMCEGCENRIKNALSTIEGVKEIVANHKYGTVKVVLNSKIQQNMIQERIEDIGFKVIKEN